jgi:hypothetical protein
MSVGRLPVNSACKKTWAARLWTSLNHQIGKTDSFISIVLQGPAIAYFNNQAPAENYPAINFIATIIF